LRRLFSHKNLLIKTNVENKQNRQENDPLREKFFPSSLKILGLEIPREIGRIMEILASDSHRFYFIFD